MDIPAQCSTTAGRGKDGIKGGKGEVFVTSNIMITALEEAVVNGVAEGEAHPVPRDIGAAAGAVSVVTS